MSRSGVSLGRAATVGLNSTSDSPADTENSTVPTASPRYAMSGAIIGTSA